MGRAGKLPTVKLDPPALKDTMPPGWLGAIGVEHWRRHINYLVVNGIVDNSTADGFAVLCDTYDRIRTEDMTPSQRAVMTKLYNTMAKQYRLMPTEIPGVRLTDRFATTPKFEFKQDE